MKIGITKLDNDEFQVVLNTGKVSFEKDDEFDSMVAKDESTGSQSNSILLASNTDAELESFLRMLASDLVLYADSLLEIEEDEDEEYKESELLSPNNTVWLDMFN